MAADCDHKWSQWAGGDDHKTYRRKFNIIAIHVPCAGHTAAQTFDQFQGTLSEDAEVDFSALDWGKFQDGVSFAMIGNCHSSTLDGHAAMLENETGRACRDPHGFSQRFFERNKQWQSAGFASAKSDLAANFLEGF